MPSVAAQSAIGRPQPGEELLAGAPLEAGAQQPEPTEVNALTVPRTNVASDGTGPVDVILGTYRYLFRYI